MDEDRPANLELAFEQHNSQTKSENEQSLNYSAYACAIAKHRLREHNEVNYESDAAGSSPNIAITESGVFDQIQ